jgi:hypothetical protein
MSRTFPIAPRPAEDRRFTLGLVIDVARVLADHGYPQVTSGPDLVALQQSLYRFLYVPEEDTP